MDMVLHRKTSYGEARKRRRSKEYDRTGGTSEEKEQSNSEAL